MRATSGCLQLIFLLICLCSNNSCSVFFLCHNSPLHVDNDVHYVNVLVGSKDDAKNETEIDESPVTHQIQRVVQFWNESKMKHSEAMKDQIHGAHIHMCLASFWKCVMLPNGSMNKIGEFSYFIYVSLKKLRICFHTTMAMWKCGTMLQLHIYITSKSLSKKILDW